MYDLICALVPFLCLEEQYQKQFYLNKNIFSRQDPYNKKVVIFSYKKVLSKLSCAILISRVRHSGHVFMSATRITSGKSFILDPTMT